MERELGVGSELGTQAWLDDFRTAVNGSDLFASTGAEWNSSLGLGFEAEAGAPTRHALLELAHGSCLAARTVDRDEFATAPCRIRAPYSRWAQVVHGSLEPMKGLLLKRLTVEGDLLKLIRFMPAAKALLEAARQVDTDVPVTESP